MSEKDLINLMRNQRAAQHNCEALRSRLLLVLHSINEDPAVFPLRLSDLNEELANLESGIDTQSETLIRIGERQSKQSTIRSKLHALRSRLVNSWTRQSNTSH